MKPHLEQRCWPLLLLWITGSLIACRLTWSDVRTIPIHSSTLTLEWNPPLTIQIDSLDTYRYRIYYRNPRSIGWTPAAEVPATEDPEITLEHEYFGDGIYEFAVTLIDNRGLESALTTSLDANVYTAFGWRVIWIKSD